MNLIELNVPVQRDADGCWTNPGIPDFDEDMEAYRAWLAAQGLETTFDLLEHEDMDHPAYVAYFDDGDCGCPLWTAAPPTGDGWHTFSIHDSEDGPVWVWARRSESQAAGGVA